MLVMEAVAQNSPLANVRLGATPRGALTFSLPIIFVFNELPPRCHRLFTNHTRTLNQNRCLGYGYGYGYGFKLGLHRSFRWLITVQYAIRNTQCTELVNEGA